MWPRVMEVNIPLAPCGTQHLATDNLTIDYRVEAPLSPDDTLPRAIHSTILVH